MGTTTISAIRDDNIISGLYHRFIDPGESTAPVDITLVVKHRFVSQTNVPKEIILQEFAIPKQYLETTGLTNLTDVEQSAEFTISNLRYLNDLFIEAMEVRDFNPIVTISNVLNADEPEIEKLPDNPIRYPEHDENLPLVVPDKNISTPKEDSGILYVLSRDNLFPVQISKRIYINTEDNQQEFKEQDYNEKIDRFFIENSMTNLIPNPKLNPVLDASIPEFWSIEDNGMVVNSNILEGPVSDTSIWQIRASNPNLFSAFNSVTLKLNETYPLFSNLNTINVSVYYRLQSGTAEIPFDSLNFKILFYNNTTLISHEIVSRPIASVQRTWLLASAELSGMQIPNTANKYSLEVDIAGIDKSDIFTLDLYLPQIEPLAVPTTRSLDIRVQDKYLTSRDVKLETPFYLMAKTYHVLGYGLRGLAANTSNQKDGIEFQVSSNRLFFKQYDTGGLIHNIASDTFNVVENTIVTYGVWITNSLLEFYINGNLLSSHPHTMVIDSEKPFFVGSLEKSNSTINSELLDFKVLKYKG